jgi:hypothetical protein
VLAHGQIPMPLAQCWIASGIDSQFGLSCLPATMTLT